MSTDILTTDGVLRATDEPGRRQALLPAPQVQNHAANLAVLPDGSLGCVWFAGTQEGVPDISVWFSRLDGRAWAVREEDHFRPDFTKTSITWRWSAM